MRSTILPACHILSCRHVATWPLWGLHGERAARVFSQQFLHHPHMRTCKHNPQVARWLVQAEVVSRHSPVRGERCAVRCPATEERPGGNHGECRQHEATTNDRRGWGWGWGRGRTTKTKAKGAERRKAPPLLAAGCWFWFLFC